MSAGDDRLVLAVDLGSTGLKVGYTTATGDPVWWGHDQLETTSDGGAATQDATVWWAKVGDLARQGLAEAGLDGQRVTGVGVTGQYSSVVPVDAEGLPVSEVVMWNDERGAEHSAEIVGGPLLGYDPRALATWVRRTGGIPNPTGLDAMAHLLHLMKDRPEVAAAARWYLEPVDHLTMRLTGRAAATPMSIVSQWLTDNRDLSRLPAYDRELVRRSGVDASRLPPLVPSVSMLGTVLPEVADSLGISPEAQVATGAPDLHAAVVGSGGTGEFQAHMSIGTTGWISFPVPFKKVDVFNQMTSIPGIGDGRYILINNQDSAGRCLDWYREAVAGSTGSQPTHDDLVALAATAEPGSGGVLFTPWLAGERSTLDDRYARGGFHNVGLSAGGPELARAVLEGVAFNSRMLLDASEKFAGRRLDPIRIIGGGARADLWCQIVADVLDRRVERVADPYLVGLRGAALLLALARGDIRHADVRALVPIDRVFTPDPATRRTYDRLFREFPTLHARNKGMFARLNA